ncbi:NAD-dependent epimerase/dehydratase family protein [Shouchella lonarensis]|uniref:2'-hydroxyisoflavone reductase n=1 Tax=Shouchella lonarensis TaxID=1464122 RepID=A0A1G6HXP2_9BACI|nr:NAD-dependent epimerase/dehydratase family protein [Shouchella lonarensis]SDB98908.1 2'-hydroxyisoflavone reductase [Shouchella lonarensis]
MKILILGGTRFVGRHLIDAALAQNHEVTLFNRGISSTKPLANVEVLHGDRNVDVSLLGKRQWDAVIDTSGYWPAQVRKAVEQLSHNVGHYTFVSSCSVYRDFSQQSIGESSDGLTLTPEQLVALDRHDVDHDKQMAHYGALKYHCEDALQQAMPGRSLIVRPGLIVGPYDRTDRFVYWMRRLLRGGEVLAPGRAERAIQVIDGRDLAKWIIDRIKFSTIGTFNVVGPDYKLTMGDFLSTCRDTIGISANFTWVDDDFLQKHDVQPWVEMPLWIPEKAHGDQPDLSGFLSIAMTKAVKLGFTFRPLEQTVRDTVQWLQNDPPDVLGSLKEAREQELLRLWHA